MARIFITGSADGLGQLAAAALTDQGHRVVVHARNEERAKEALRKVPAAEAVLIADLSDTEQTKTLAAAVNALGRFDAVIHNAGIYNQPADRMLHVNTLAPYILTCLIEKPKRIVYMTSGMHLQGSSRLPDVTDTGRISYSDTKLHVVLLSQAIARAWPDVCSNAVNPGWVPTKMGGKGAPDDLYKGVETQVWLAAGDEEKANVSGRYFYHKKEQQYHADADNIPLQERFLTWCEQISGVRFSG